MARQEKLKHENSSLPFGLLFPSLCNVNLYYASTKPPCGQEHLSTIKSNILLAINKTTA